MSSLAIPFFRPSIGEAEIEAVVAVLRSGWLTTGSRSKLFEEAFSVFLGDTNIQAIAVNSATAGLHLAAEACGIGPGDAVLVPTLTFSATAAVFRHLGADIILVDVHPDSLTIDLEDAARRITARCKAIAPVHFGGWPCDMDEILAFAQKHGLRVIEDAAHALPAHRQNRKVGTSGSDACVFSFYANKTITTGEGGMLVTRDEGIAARARVMRLHGLDRDAFDRFRSVTANWAYDIVAPGFKYNLTDLAASIGIVQLDRAYEFQRQREHLALRYAEALADLPIDLPALAPEGGQHAWHIFPIRVREHAPIGRDALIATLTQNGIGSSVHYCPLHLMTYWRQNAQKAIYPFPVADRYFAGAVTLPLFPGMKDHELDRVCSVLRAVLR
ncbi:MULTISPECIES: DegT/DnrJ/EryC1/StrS aminotransferase family protein [unclassified Beijerinckia]|uniref:DegT/DnrJ/EryC1/StrS family aminotransferase n=1 Tax=unclassified Beijerinckia TaxID=2638183 RepID=UPI00089A38DC|nr:MULTISPECIES: DegT/DnrJ/EryC1/StrS aminotransferase family protein [unclassified Beijerinckia]MDH7796992.1 dTDP-4-amino-4,6-dideoxygalactose transaminase [Beijerinckia sp. GAS462]SEC67789.1 dTDP-4-amino-4,6-dideoxygalactose transaminase [Beijerinckia sp. 28-YEA-48]